MWFRVNHHFHENQKVRAVRRSHPAKRKDASAAGVWVQAATWSAVNEMDGFCPEEFVETLDDDWQSIVQRLEAAVGPSGRGLFEPAVVNGEPGWIVHDFLEFNDSKEEQDKLKRAKAMRSALQRDVALVTEIKRRDRDRCRYCGTQVDWRNRRGNASATYDHVKPLSAGGVNTLDNVVVACKGCNDRKGERSLREAGMKLLEPGSKGAPVIDGDRSDSSTYQTRTKNDSDRAGSTGPTGTVRSGPGVYDVSDTSQNQGAQPTHDETLTPAGGVR